MRFFRLSRDEVLERQADDGRPTQGLEVLWPSGRWAPIADSYEDHLQRMPLTEAEAQVYADERVGRPVDLFAPRLTDEEHAAAIERSRAHFVPNDVADWGSKQVSGAYAPGTTLSVNGEPFDPSTTDAMLDGPDAGAAK